MVLRIWEIEDKEPFQHASIDISFSSIAFRTVLIHLFFYEKQKYIENENDH